MKTLILFYSRTGTTGAVAEALAGALEADIANIECPRYRPGWFRYLRAGYDSVTGRLPPIDLPRIAFAEYDLLVLGTPVWTSYPALPVRSFLSQSPGVPSRVALFLTFGGHSPPEKAVKFVAERVSVTLEATLVLRHETVVRAAISEAIDGFVANLNAPRE